MKKIYVIALLGLCILSACENSQDVQSDVDKLRAERAGLQSEISNLNSNATSKNSEVLALEGKLKELKIYESGKVPKYILKLKLKQSHMTLSISKHMKDAMNAIEFEMPVDKDFYNSVSEGTNIVNEFRAGSAILYGSFGNWEMTVEDKEIR